MRLCNYSNTHVCGYSNQPHACSYGNHTAGCGVKSIYANTPRNMEPLYIVVLHSWLTFARLGDHFGSKDGKLSGDFYHFWL